MLNKMSDAQRSMLRAAATRDDLLLTPSASARTAAVKSFAVKLLDAGWAKEVKGAQRLASLAQGCRQRRRNPKYGLPHSVSGLAQLNDE